MSSAGLEYWAHKPAPSMRRASLLPASLPTVAPAQLADAGMRPATRPAPCDAAAARMHGSPVLISTPCRTVFSTGVDVDLRMPSDQPAAPPSPASSSTLSEAASSRSPGSDWATTPDTREEIFQAAQQQRSAKVPRITIDSAPVASTSRPRTPTSSSSMRRDGSSASSSRSSSAAAKGKGKAKAKPSLLSPAPRKRKAVALDDEAYGDDGDGEDPTADPYAAPLSAAHDELYVARTTSVSPLPVRPTFVERDARRTADAKKPYHCDVLAADVIVTLSQGNYLPYFVDPADPARPPSEWARKDVPVAVLEYPGFGGVEHFPLLQPRHVGNDYNPINDLISVVRTVLDEMLTPAQARDLFEHEQTPVADRPDPFAPPTAVLSDDGAESKSVLARLERAALAADGPAFLAAVEAYNVQLRALRHALAFETNVRNMRGLDDRLWTRITSQAYERAVGPEIARVKSYVAWTDNVYGELLPRLVADIVHLTELGPGKLLVDLGSGVGNCCVQASLASGCDSIGFEIMEAASELATAQCKEFEARCAMWGVSSGHVETARADFCKDERVGQALARADVVLCNNYVFSARTNETLSNLFLELKDGAYVVSLKPFVPPSFTLNRRTIGSPLAILEQLPRRRWAPMSVSWTAEAGTFYVTRVDRSRVAKWIAANGL